MTVPLIGRTRERALRQWIRGFWTFYRDYTSSAVHTASAAALAIFGLLVFIDPLFAVVAIASYVGPPLVLYSIDAGVGSASHDSPESTPDGNDDGVSSTPPIDSDGGSGPDSDSWLDRRGDGEDVTGRTSEHTDDVAPATEADDSDTDTDSDDGDSDSDADGGDTDSDSDSDS